MVKNIETVNDWLKNVTQLAKHVTKTSGFACHSLVKINATASDWLNLFTKAKRTTALGIQCRDGASKRNTYQRRKIC